MEKLRDKKDYRNLRDKEKRNRTIRQEIKKFLKDLDLPEKAKKEYEEFYFLILQDEKLVYFS